MNFNVLRYVVAVAEEKSFTRAAKRLQVSQPSLSQGVQSLEKQLGVRLFDRKTSPLTLTEAGNLYVDWAKGVLLSQSRLDRQIDSLEGRRSRLVVGSAPHHAALLLPDTIAAFLRRFPDCDLVIEEGTAAELYDRLARGIDLLVAAPHIDTVRYSSVHILRERLLLAVPAAYGIEGAEESGSPYARVRLSDVRDRPFLSFYPDIHPTRSLRALCEREDFVPIPGVVCRRSETAHALVARGLGVVLLPELLVSLGPPLPGVEYFAVEGGDPCCELAVVSNAATTMNNHAVAFVELLLEHTRALRELEE